MSVRLNEDEAWSVIKGAHTGIITTLRADGSPVTLPMWFVVIDGSVCFFTFAPTKKVARINRDPRASFLVESGKQWIELRAVHLSGRLEPITDEATIARIDETMDEKYAAFRTEHEAMPAATQARYQASKRFYRLVPEQRMLTWDNARLRLQDKA